MVSAVAEVDMLLVLALDASGSLTDESIALQRRGHAQAVASRDFVRAVRRGGLGRVALIAFEWSDHGRQAELLPWTVVEDEATARRCAAGLLAAPRSIPGFTSISGAIDHAAALLAQAPHDAPRRVIDVSGNGENNDGRLVQAARDEAVAQGLTINGLPMLDRVHDLDSYFRGHVIGGPDAFMLVARDADDFALAILRKLLLEVSGHARG